MYRDKQDTYYVALGISLSWSDLKFILDVAQNFTDTTELLDFKLYLLGKKV